VHGFATFDPALKLGGVVFNRIGGPAHLQYLQDALSQLPGVTCCGGLPRSAELAIPERHLGLTTAEDYPLGEDYLEKLADLLETHLDLDGLLATLSALSFPAEIPPAAVAPAVRLAVARDRAFCFYYPENLELLAASGAELVFFSPLTDRELPPNLDGVYLGGGYPELFAAELAANSSLRRSLQEQAAAGLPIYAECGGLMYLSRELEDLEGRSHPLAGVLPLKVRMLKKLRALGYREITLTAAGLLGPEGTQARGHEFHYSEIAGGAEGLERLYRLTSRRGQETAAEGFTVHNVLASYVHLHFASNPAVARHLVERCRLYKERR
jgi:cobyrinic acid a,c-diamide synthase